VNTGAHVDGELQRLRAVTLPELESTAALLIRRDRKYIVPVDAAERLLVALRDRCRILEIDGRRRFRYESVYFDTPARTSYLSAARRRRQRYKVRTRAYLDMGRCVLEVKTRDSRGRTVKTQHDHAMDARGRLDSPDQALVSSYPSIGEDGSELRPALVTRYTRSTMLLDSGGRATIDTAVEAEAPDGRMVTLAGMVIVESKSIGAPSDVDRALWAMGHRPIRISKFCTSLAALFPELPANKWQRALEAPWVVRDAATGDREFRSFRLRPGTVTSG
jgi:hypothetical protein